MKILFLGALQLLIIQLVSSVTALLDCYHGFVGRMQASVEDEFIPVNETRLCAAYLCIKVIVHAGIDDDNVFQQGVSSRCGYTGGDRAACSRIDGCTTIPVFDGMSGNFSFCCCHTPHCNRATDDELESIYAETRRKKAVKVSSSIDCYSLPSLLLLTRLFDQYL
ncbi:LU (Ly6 Urokinase plasminogen) domain Receptor Protein [Trichostrongylus colubriformis]|uniref:LU (Ly6 Urokinase plasminogen) domain Receptor Protein n=1 Tax=Trichostrongylus colubriformis TaxID=6319 RepID=A0AAN8F8A6_TRICO